MYFLFSSYFYCLCVVVDSVNWKLMTLKKIPCIHTQAYLAIKALSDSYYIILYYICTGSNKALSLKSLVLGSASATPLAA